MFLMSLANDLARRESMIAFLCLVVAHLEWPDMPHQSQCGDARESLQERTAADQPRIFARVRRLRLVVRGLKVFFASSFANGVSVDDPLRGFQ